MPSKQYIEVMKDIDNFKAKKFDKIKVKSKKVKKSKLSENDAVNLILKKIANNKNKNKFEEDESRKLSKNLNEAVNYLRKKERDAQVKADYGNIGKLSTGLSSSSTATASANKNKTSASLSPSSTATASVNKSKTSASLSPSSTASATAAVKGTSKTKISMNPSSTATVSAPMQSPAAPPVVSTSAAAPAAPTFPNGPGVFPPPPSPPSGNTSTPSSSSGGTGITSGAGPSSSGTLPPPVPAPAATSASASTSTSIPGVGAPANNPSLETYEIVLPNDSGRYRIAETNKDAAITLTKKPKSMADRLMLANQMVVDALALVEKGKLKKPLRITGGFRDYKMIAALKCQMKAHGLIEGDDHKDDVFNANKGFYLDGKSTNQPWISERGGELNTKFQKECINCERKLIGLMASKVEKITNDGDDKMPNHTASHSGNNPVLWKQAREGLELLNTDDNSPSLTTAQKTKKAELMQQFTENKKFEYLGKKARIKSRKNHQKQRELLKKNNGNYFKAVAEKSANSTASWYKPRKIEYISQRLPLIGKYLTSKTTKQDIEARKKELPKYEASIKDTIEERQKKIKDKKVKTPAYNPGP